jgi:hypothetical protein
MKNERVFHGLDAVITRGVLFCGAAASPYNTNQTIFKAFDGALNVDGGRLYKLVNTLPDENGDFIFANNLVFNTGFDIGRPGQNPSGVPYQAIATAIVLCNIVVFLIPSGGGPAGSEIHIAQHESLSSVSGNVFPTNLLSTTGLTGVLPLLKDENNNDYINIPAGYDVHVAMRQRATLVAGGIVMGVTAYCHKY